MEQSSSVLGTTVINAITKGCTDVATGATEGITAVLPMGLQVTALTVGIGVAISFFRRLAH